MRGDNNMKISFKNIKVSSWFENSVPREEKLVECREYYNTYGKLDREIVIDFDGYIIDGYIGYLILKENEYSGKIRVKQSAKRKKKWYRKGVNVSYKNISTIYVFGKHHEDGKEFVWRVPEAKRELVSELTIGNEIAVATKYGTKTVVITRIQELSECPVDGYIKKVIL